MLNSIPIDHSDNTPRLRRASNSFKQGLYSKKLTYSTPGNHQLYSDILRDYVQYYRPITPDEETLVQQLTALQFRHLKVQTFQADSMCAEVLRQCRNTAPDADGCIPTATAIENPFFRLHIQGGEQMAQQEETKLLLEPLSTKEAFIDCYNQALNDPTRQALLCGPRKSPELLAFYRVSGLTEANLRKWVAEAVQVGLIKLPDKPQDSPKAA